MPPPRGIRPLLGLGPGLRRRRAVSAPSAVHNGGPEVRHAAWPGPPRGVSPAASAVVHVRGRMPGTDADGARPRRGAARGQEIVRRACPEGTVVPGAASIAPTVPSLCAWMGCSIFIASRTTTRSPLTTC